MHNNRLNQGRQTLATHLQQQMLLHDGRTYVPAAAFDDVPGISASPDSGKTAREIAMGNARNMSIFPEINKMPVRTLDIDGRPMQVVEVRPEVINREAGDKPHAPAMRGPHAKLGNRALAAKFLGAVTSIDTPDAEPAHYIETKDSNGNARFSDDEIARALRAHWIAHTTTQSPSPEHWVRSAPAPDRYDVPDLARLEAAEAGLSQAEYVKNRRADSPDGHHL